MTPETDLILRALDDLRDDLIAQRAEMRHDFGVVYARLDETRQLVARIDERTRPVPEEPATRGAAVKDLALRHAPAAGVSAFVVAAVELIPELLKVFR